MLTVGDGAHPRTKRKHFRAETESPGTVFPHKNILSPITTVRNWPSSVCDWPSFIVDLDEKCYCPKDSAAFFPSVGSDGIQHLGGHSILREGGEIRSANNVDTDNVNRQNINAVTARDCFLNTTVSLLECG